VGFVPVLFFVFCFFFQFFENFCQICVLFVCVFFELGVFIKLSCACVYQAFLCVFIKLSFVCVCGRSGGVFELFLCSCGKEILFGAFLSVEGHLRIVRRKGNQILQMEGGRFWE
jgi:hypothetical protein